MAKAKEVKTNAMRILDQKHIAYETVSYECKEFVDGVHIADMLGQPYEISFKTLVTVGNTGEHFVFVLPIAEELDLKKAARSVGAKSVSMIHVKDITAVTGYIRGGCTALGMKKQFVTRIHESARNKDRIIISGGRIGSQIHLAPKDFILATGAEYADIIMKETDKGRG